jgi:hypothetical protein
VRVRSPGRNRSPEQQTLRVVFLGGQELEGRATRFRPEGNGLRLRAQRTDGSSTRLNVPYFAIRYLVLPATPPGTAELGPAPRLVVRFCDKSQVAGELLDWPEWRHGLLLRERCRPHALFVPRCAVHEVIWRPRPGESLPPRLPAACLLVEDHVRREAEPVLEAAAPP